VSVGTLSPRLLAQEGGGTLSQEETAGKKMFYQRCSLCHLPAVRDRTRSAPKPYGPQLNGFVHDSQTEAQARLRIQNGSPGRMPGFQYGLQPEEIDQILAYLKTFK
jgi:mono/diheme cytochrome c family protein